MTNALALPRFRLVAAVVLLAALLLLLLPVLDSPASAATESAPRSPPAR